MESSKDPYRLVTGFGSWRIGDIRVSDGPHGMRAQEDGERNNDSREATCFPTACCIACSWDTELIGQMAAGIAAEAQELGVSVVLGPGVNIKRSPLCGRNFEYFSEDPYLAGMMAAAYIRSMQEAGVGTSLKHFACNSQETHRMTADSIVDERALHEIYLTAFEIAVKTAQPDTVMAAYNYVNGLPACENKELLTEILREKWGFQGLVMSDWGACVDLPACLSAGMDVEMPDSNGNHESDLREALQKGTLSRERLEEAVSRIRALCDRRRSHIPVSEPLGRVSEETRKKNHRLAARLAEESAVLLKNDHAFFPIASGAKILMIGDLADHPRYQGGGSSHIHTERVDGMLKAFLDRGTTAHLVKGYQSNTFARNTKLEEEALAAVREAAGKDIPILFFGGLTDQAEGEGYDRESFDLPENQSALLAKILEITDRIGFISFGGSPYDMSLPDQCSAILQLYLGGESVSAACAGIVTGAVNPSGKLAESIPYSEKDVPSYGCFGRQGQQAEHPDDVEYRESIFVGYRYYETFRKPVRYCFGHGLSYTTFAYSNLRIEQMEDCGCRVSFMLENTGEIAGSEICQVYVKNPDDGSFRPARELRGFAKIRLEAGERKSVEINLNDRAFSAWQEDDFRVIGGEYEIQVGASLNDIRLRGTLSVTGETLRCPLNRDVTIPLTDEDFDRICTTKRLDLSHIRPGSFTRKNSLAQMMPYSRLARLWARIGRIAVRLMLPMRSADDPEVRMMAEGLIEGNIDSVSNQSGGILSRKTVDAIVASANRRRSE